MNNGRIRLTGNRATPSMQMSNPGDGFPMETVDDRTNKLKAMGALNAQRPPLPVSPCVKIIDTGEVLVWKQQLADRWDLCVNCDEYGNEDPAAWQGRGPHVGNLGDTIAESVKKKRLDEIKAQQQRDLKKAMPQEQLPSPPPGLLFYPEQFATNDTLPGIPNVAQASAILGVPERFSQEYHQPSQVRAPLQVKYAQSGVTVSEYARQQLQNAMG